MHWGVRHDRRKQSVAKRRSSQKKKAAKKKSIKERAKERIAKVDKQKVKDIAKTSAIILGKAAVAASLSAIGGTAALYAINEISNAYTDTHFVGPRYGNTYNVNGTKTVFGPYKGRSGTHYDIGTMTTMSKNTGLKDQISKTVPLEPGWKVNMLNVPSSWDHKVAEWWRKNKK